MSRRHWQHPFAALLLFAVVSAHAEGPPTAKSDDRPVEPVAAISLLDGKGLAHFYAWQKGTGREDPLGVYRIENGVAQISGEGAGYLATRQPYRNYHLSAEYKWGARTDGSKYVRNSGILLHAVGPDGGRNGTWMTSIEVQLAQGCEGDLIVIRGEDSEGNIIPATISSRTRTASDGRTRWQPDGVETLYSGKQFWWKDHQAGFKELLDTRGQDDVASPLGEWTRVECLCRDDRITIKINGVTVNEAYNVFPTSGKILLQNEGNEVFFRNVVLSPLPAKQE